VAFSAKVSDTDNKFDGIWYGKNGDPDPLVVNGDTIPDVGAISAFGDLTVLSSSGKLISFVATTGSLTGIFVLDTTTKKIRLVARNGESVYDFAGTLSAIQPGAVNNRGQVAFGIKSSGEAAQSEDLDRVNALFFANPSGTPKKVIANGDTVIVKGKSKRVIDIRFAPTRGLNDLGYLAFTASFNDRTSGVFVVRP
jgi:hypothetical protein